MSLGGGYYVTEDKLLPGAYINFVTTERGSVSLSERGVGALGITLEWGDAYGVVDRDEVVEKSLSIFGYDYNRNEMLPIREFFKNAKRLVFFRLNRSGVKANSDYGYAKYHGTRGNKIKVIIRKNLDLPNLFDVETYMEDVLVDTQTAANVNQLVDNDYVTWKRTTALAVGTYEFTGGNSISVNGSAVQAFCQAMENYSFNAIAALVDDEDAYSVIVEFTKRMREENGIKFQCVVSGGTFDYEGCISLYELSSLDGNDPVNILAWICGAAASCNINESLTNKVYNGEIIIDTEYSKSTFNSALKSGYFIFYSDNDNIRVLRDINSLVSTSTEKGEAFKNNQTVRLIDQIATDIANLFTTYYLGKVQNDTSGRNSLWSDLVSYHENLQLIRAIEFFEEEDISVSLGKTKESVVVSESIIPINSMEKLYMKVYIN